MRFETERLLLRPWTIEDAESLYEYAKDPLVGPIAGWPVHTNVENSREIIKSVLLADETYAVCLKENNKAVGSIGLMIGEKSNIDIAKDEGEIGYWIGVPFWGQGLIPEAMRELMRYAFDDLGMKQLWCGYFEGNMKSKRVQEKCGFKYHHTNKDIKWPLMNDIRTEHINHITRLQWRERMSKHSKVAKEVFEKGYNCSQAVFAAFCDVTELDFDTALKISSSFGGGMGKLREVCGAVTGMFMVLGIVNGYSDPSDQNAKTQHYELIHTMGNKFKERHKSIICRDLLELTEENNDHVPEERTEKYYKERPCSKLVEEAAMMLDDYLDSRK